MSARTRGMDVGGIGAIHGLARRMGLVEGAIDDALHLLKVHLPYHEADHVLNIAFDFLAGGRCLEDLERLRNAEVYLDALGTQRIPDPTTAGEAMAPSQPRRPRLRRGLAKGRRDRGARARRDACASSPGPACP